MVTAMPCGVLCPTPKAAGGAGFGLVGHFRWPRRCQPAVLLSPPGAAGAETARRGAGPGKGCLGIKEVVGDGMRYPENAVFVGDFLLYFMEI